MSTQQFLSSAPSLSHFSSVQAWVLQGSRKYLLHCGTSPLLPSFLPLVYPLFFLKPSGFCWWWFFSCCGLFFPSSSACLPFSALGKMCFHRCVTHLSPGLTCSQQWVHYTTSSVQNTEALTFHKGHSCSPLPLSKPCHLNQTRIWLFFITFDKFLKSSSWITKGPFSTDNDFSLSLQTVISV